jgi:hypothetical protein
LQFGDVPDRIANLVEAPRPSSLTSSLRGLGAAVARSPEAIALRLARAALGDSELEELASMNRRFGEATVKAVVDVVDSSVIAYRDHYRAGVIRSLIKAASSGTAEYIRAFENADQLVQLVWASVAYLAVFQVPVELQLVTVVSRELSTRAWTVVLCHDERVMFSPPFNCVLVLPAWAGPAADPILLAGMKSRFGPLGSAIRVTGPVLEGAANIFPRGTGPQSPLPPWFG